MLVIGLTGGIATGKSTVAAILRQQGVSVLDCDEIAHAVVRKSVLLPSGEIDRDKLGELVFNDKVARRKLNAATHLPVAVQLVRQLALKWLGLTCVTVVDMPLLFETGAHKLMWPRVFVTCSHKAEVERLIKRDKCTSTQAEAKVAAQMPLEKKKAMAQVIIDNSGDPSHCKQQVLELVQQLQGKYKWAGAATSPPVLAGAFWLVLRMIRSSVS